jgi:hypothetical protein
MLSNSSGGLNSSGRQRGQPAGVAQAVRSAGGRGQADREQEGTGIGTSCQFDEFGSRDADLLGDRQILPSGAIKATQLQPRWSRGHHDSPQRLDMLIGNMDQPACGVRTDPAQRSTIASMEETIRQTGRDARNCSHIIDTERAACHQISQLRSERSGINPVIASPLVLAKHCHTTSPSSSPLSVEGFVKGPNVNGFLKLANFCGAAGY